MFSSIKAGSVRSGVDVFTIFEDHVGSQSRSAGVSSDVRKAAGEASKRQGFKGETGETVVMDDGSILLGLGKKDGLSLDTLRTAAARLLKRLDRLGAAKVKLHVADALSAADIKPKDAGRAIGEALGLSNWRVDFFDGKAANRSKPAGALSVSGDEAAVTSGMKDGLAVAEAVNEARRIGATPPNVCNPEWMAKESRRLARTYGLKCTVISYAEAQRQGMGGLVNVGKASASKPCMIMLEHKPQKTKRKDKLCLVGKTITYDTGGYSLKLSGGMKGMKYDKNGGCAVLGAMLAIAALDLPVHVVALLPAAENMVAGDAYRPDDIITMYNGVSVEVTNTDAEGRLVLADALAYACKKVKPTAILDAATLTGGVVVALGMWSAGLWCNDDDLRSRIEGSAETNGEKVWRMPLWTEHRDFMRSQHADIWNSGPKRDGHPIQGAAFLSYFVDEDVPWAHVDIAGVNKVDSDTDMYVAGPTGFGVRLLTGVAESYC